MKRIENFHWELNQQRILKIMGSPSDGPIFERLVKLFAYFSRGIAEFINPVGIYQFTHKPSSFSFPETENCPQVVFCFLTLGEEVDVRINKYFAHGKYLEAMLLDIIANEILFMCTEQLYAKVVGEARNRRWGVTPRLEPGSEDVPLDLQKEALANLDLEGLNVSLTESNMLIPLKSLTFFCGVGENIATALTKGHICDNCSRKDCHYRH